MAETTWRKRKVYTMSTFGGKSGAAGGEGARLRSARERAFSEDMRNDCAAGRGREQARRPLCRTFAVKQAENGGAAARHRGVGRPGTSKRRDQRPDFRVARFDRPLEIVPKLSGNTDVGLVLPGSLTWPAA